MLSYSLQKPTFEELLEFFYNTDDDFTIPLRTFLDLETYVRKLYIHASIYTCREDNKIVGVLCCYTNRPPEAYISHICVAKAFQHQGIFSTLHKMLVSHCLEKSITSISLQVNKENTLAYNLYIALGYSIISQTDTQYTLQLSLQ